MADKMLANQSLCLVSFNIENLFIEIPPGISSPLSLRDEALWQSWSTRLEGQKSLEKTRGLATTIKELDADVYMLCEVGGLNSLKNFNTFFLEDKYHCLCPASNSDRGIDIGYLISKKLPFRYQIHSNTHRYINFHYPTPPLNSDPKGEKFSRDVLELSLSFNDKIIWHIMLTHLKSKLDKNGDFQGRGQRTQEVHHLVDLYQQRRSTLGREVPIIIAGDLNSNASLHNTDSECLALRQQTPLKDTLELTAVSHDKRCSFQYFYDDNRFEPMQLDYIFVEPDNVLVQEAYVYYYPHLWQEKIGAPVAQKREKEALPSDHFPIFSRLQRQTPQA